MRRGWIGLVVSALAFAMVDDAAADRPSFPPGAGAPPIGREVSIPRHLRDGDETRLPGRFLFEHGRALFAANWTGQEGGGRPLTKGNGRPLADPSAPLLFPRNFNRVSAPDANSCAGCHNAPFGIAGGGGDIVTNVFVLGQRFDFATFDASDPVPTRGTTNEAGLASTLQNIANFRNTPGMFGSGYIEMLARQMTADLQRLRDATTMGGQTRLVTKGVEFGWIARRADGTWDASRVEGLPAPSLATTGTTPPSLVIRPFHQAGAVVSLREFTNNAFNHHHGIQSTERFGAGSDPDGDGFQNEMTRADVTAAAIFQAALPVPGRVIPRQRDVERAVRRGERLFAEVGCATCHRAALPLDDRGWIFSEPNPYNPAGNLRPGEAPTVSIDLGSNAFPGPRLREERGVVRVPAYTDLKLHDITTGAPDDPNREPLDMTQAAGSAGFFAGNAKFLTRKLWGAANEPPYFHHGQYTTMREAVLAHFGEADATRRAFTSLGASDQDAVIEFLKTLRVLAPGSEHRIVDEWGQPRDWDEARR